MTFRDPFAEGEWYHCYNRGVDKRVIFRSKSDFERFLMLLYVSNSSTKIHLSNLAQHKRQGPTVPFVLDVERGDPLVEIGAYALMPNHFHILFKASNPKEASLFMQKVATGYSMYFNKKYSRTGTLFESKFKSRRVDNDLYFKRLLNYIHANPAELYEPSWKKGIISDEVGLYTKLSNYRFSSLQDYLKIERVESKIIHVDTILEMLDSPYNISSLIDEAKTFARAE